MRIFFEELLLGHSFHLAGNDGFAGVGAGAGGETEGEGAEVIAGAVGWLAALFDGEEEFGHRAVEAGGEPVASEPGRGDSFGGVEGDSLLCDGGAARNKGADGAGEVGVSINAKSHIGIEDERGLGVLVFDQHLAEERGLGFLGG